MFFHNDLVNVGEGKTTQEQANVGQEDCRTNLAYDDYHEYGDDHDDDGEGEENVSDQDGRTDYRHDDGDNGDVNDDNDDGNGANKDPTSPSVAFHQIVGKRLPVFFFNSFHIVWKHTHVA